MNDGSDPHKTAVGYAEASILLGPSGGTFNGEAVDGSAILLKYTYLGDSNLDGNVNALDFNALASNFGTSVVTGAFKPSWTEGDYNFDGTVDSSDFTAMAVNFNLALPAPALGTLIPEPCGLAAVALIVGLRIRRRSSRRF
jgi:hypothetical protein